MIFIFFNLPNFRDFKEFWKWARDILEAVKKHNEYHEKIEIVIKRIEDRLDFCDQKDAFIIEALKLRGVVHD